MRITTPVIYSLYFLLSMFLFSCQKKSERGEGSSLSLNEIGEKMHYLLKDRMLGIWYPRAIDSIDGGYLSVLDDQWKPRTDQGKFIVTQARHLWTLAVAMERYDDKVFSAGARHGFEFLRDKMWDSEFGGFYDLRTKAGGVPEGDAANDKRAYGNSFAIYGLSAYARASGNKEALELAKKGFWWLEAHSFDSIYGGYNQYLTREGIPYHEAYGDDIPYYQHFKDQNYSIHIMEAYTELYRLWPNDTLKEKLTHLFYLIRDKITNEDGHMTLFFYQDWSPVSYKDSAEINYRFDHVSFGHDIETAYLLLEASNVLGIYDETTLEKTKLMVDHSLKGIDEDVGGLFERGYYFNGELAIVDSTKSWWPQVEGMNSLLLFYGLFPKQEQYKESFISLWNYCDQYMIDWENGGWYTKGIDKEAELKTSNKGGYWKGPYHTTRSLVNCIDLLENGVPY